MSNMMEGAIIQRNVLQRGWRWVVVLVLFGTVVVGYFDRISIAVLFTNVDFYTAIGTGFNPTKLGFLMTAFLFAYGISSILLGFVGDRFGPGRVLSTLTAVWGVLMAGMGMSGSFTTMIFARLALGITEGPQFSLISKLVLRWFPGHERGRANSVWMMGAPIGSAIGFPLSIWLVHVYGWRATFYVFAAFSLLIMAPLILMVTRQTGQETAAMPAAAASIPRTSPALFLTNYRFWLVTAYGCGLLMYLWGLNSWLPTYLERSRHFNLREMGIFSSLPFIFIVIGGVTSGWLADRMRRKAVLCAAGLFSAACLLYLATHIREPHLAAFVIALSAGCWGLGSPSQYALSMEILPPSVIATGIGVQNGIGNLFGACAPVLIGWVVGQTGSFESGLLVIVLAGLAGAILILPLVRHH